jgi:hypothetical protein
MGSQPNSLTITALPASAIAGNVAAATIEETTPRRNEIVPPPIQIPPPAKNQNREHVSRQSIGGESAYIALDKPCLAEKWSFINLSNALFR